jgi:hypothetical protein
MHMSGDESVTLARVIGDRPFPELFSQFPGLQYGNIRSIAIPDFGDITSICVT